MNVKSNISNIQLVMETAKLATELLITLLMIGNVILLSLATKNILLIVAVLAVSACVIVRLIKKVHLWINK